MYNCARMRGSTRHTSTGSIIFDSGTYTAMLENGVLHGEGQGIVMNKDGRKIVKKRKDTSVTA